MRKFLINLMILVAFSVASVLIVYHFIKAEEANASISVLEEIRVIDGKWRSRIEALEDELAELLLNINSLFSIEGRSFEGLASWYGAGFDSRFTASGEIFDPLKLTAAHRSLAFGTILRVENLRNRRAVIVKVNDRGPFRNDRIIDLSAEAAARIGSLRDGLTPVRVTIISSSAMRELMKMK